jgi:hypothetical protein
LEKGYIISGLPRRFSAEITKFVVRDLSAQGPRRPAQLPGLGGFWAKREALPRLFALDAGHDRLSASASALK